MHFPLYEKMTAHKGSQQTTLFQKIARNSLIMHDLLNVSE